MQIPRRRRRKSHANRARRSSQPSRTCSHVFFRLLPPRKTASSLPNLRWKASDQRGGISDKTTSRDLAAIVLETFNSKRRNVRQHVSFHVPGYHLQPEY